MPTEKPTYKSVRLADRTKPFQESVIREMTRLGDEAGAVNLSQGLPDYPAPPEVLSAAIEAIRLGENQYTFPFGLPGFRSAIAYKSRKYNHINADSETSITVTCGVSEAIVSTVLALTEPGDEVILFEPWYENYVPACTLAGVTPHFVPLHEPDYVWAPAELRAAFNNKTRLVILNTPHNPTGRVFTRSELEQLSSLCQEFGVIAITDEIYEYILYGNNVHTSLGSLDGMQDRTVTISGLGKTYALTGWRIGWAIAHPDITALIRKVHDYMTICAPAPFQLAGITALGLPKKFYTALRTEYAARCAILLPALTQAGFRYRPPEGAYYVMADFAELAWPINRYSRPEWSLDRAFAEYMAREVGVAVVPCSSFYSGKKDGFTRVRLNFAKQPHTLREAARRLENLPG